MILRIEFTLTEAREAAGMSQADLAIALGTTRQNVHQLEGRKSLPKLQTVERVINALGIADLSQIMRIVETK